MDPFPELRPHVPHVAGAKLSEQRIRELAAAALADRALDAVYAVDSDESTSRVTLTSGDLRRTTRFSADADPDLVSDLVRKAAKRLERDLRGGRTGTDH